MSAELPKMPTAFEVVYEFPSPFGGVHRKLDSNRWNGSTPTTSQPVYSQDQLITFAQEATRQAMERCAAQIDSMTRARDAALDGIEAAKAETLERAARVCNDLADKHNADANLYRNPQTIEQCREWASGARQCAQRIRALTNESEKRHG